MLFWTSICLLIWYHYSILYHFKIHIMSVCLERKAWFDFMSVYKDLHISLCRAQTWAEKQRLHWPNISMWWAWLLSCCSHTVSFGRPVALCQAWEKKTTLKGFKKAVLYSTVRGQSMLLFLEGLCNNFSVEWCLLKTVQLSTSGFPCCLVYLSSELQATSWSKSVPLVK